MQILSLPRGGREIVFKKLSAQVYQTQLKEEENNSESIAAKKKSNVSLPEKQ